MSDVHVFGRLRNKLVDDISTIKIIRCSPRWESAVTAAVNSYEVGYAVSGGSAVVVLPFSVEFDWAQPEATILFIHNDGRREEWATVPDTDEGGRDDDG